MHTSKYIHDPRSASASAGVSVRGTKNTNIHERHYPSPSRRRAPRGSGATPSLASSRQKPPPPGTAPPSPLRPPPRTDPPRRRTASPSRQVFKVFVRACAQRSAARQAGRGALTFATKLAGSIHKQDLWSVMYTAGYLSTETG